MTPAQIMARAQRADQAWAEFFEPMIAEMKAEYSARMIEVASTELNAARRADKITALSHALKIVGNLESGMRQIVRDGEVASREMIRAEKIESMTAPQRRLFSIAPR